MGTTERRDEAEGIAHQVQHPERAEIYVIAGIPASGAAVPALIGSHHVITRCGQRQHHFAPAVGQLGKTVQQQEAGTARPLESRLQHVNPETVDVIDEARAYALSQRWRTERLHPRGLPTRASAASPIVALACMAIVLPGMTTAAKPSYSTVTSWSVNERSRR